MGKNMKDKSLKTFEFHGQEYTYYSLLALKEEGYDVEHLPYSIRVLLEGVIRQLDGRGIVESHIEELANWTIDKGLCDREVPFKPARVILQDFTGVPAVVDLASLRSAMDKGVKKTSNEKEEYIQRINPEVDVDLVIDHSVQVDSYGSCDSLTINMNKEFERNMERYRFLNWAKGEFNNFNVVPPATGIVHQVNLEYLAKVVNTKKIENKTYIYPDTLVGTDSHTTMINGLGVLGWGVGGIEAEAGMLGQPSFFRVPEVIGVKLTGTMKAGTTATDLALHITALLRKVGVVNKFVEYFGSGLQGLSLADRATVANMAPEYGATCGFFPVDDKTLDYLKLTGRNSEHIQLAKEYLTQNMLYQTSDSIEPIYTNVVELDLSTVDSSLAGPKRPQDLISLSNMKNAFVHSVTAPLGNQGHGLSEKEFEKRVIVQLESGKSTELETGSLVIASITSCTNTSNPDVMLGAGLLAKKAVDLGLAVPDYVKTSLAPGSKVVTGYLKNANLLEPLEQLGFHVVGYGCATCIGNSGGLLPELESAIVTEDLLVSSVLSGNRNFEGRIHPLVKANYLASPILVIAYAIAGTVKIDMENEPLAYSKDGKAVYLKDIWPSKEEIDQVVAESVTPALFKEEYEKVYEDNEKWNEIDVEGTSLFQFDESSTYIQNPTFFDELEEEPKEIAPLEKLAVICKFKDSITTDHISPAGSIGVNTPAGKYLLSHGVKKEDFNTYGSRRGNHEVMMRGTFANIRIRNEIAGGKEGGYTTYFPTEEVMPIYDACMKYKEDKTGLIVLAGKDYGMGSSRDWAAKGPNLLGVKAVIAESYERIHRSNLVMMGVLPIEYINGETAESLGLKGDESFFIEIHNDVKPLEVVKINAVKKDGSKVEFQGLVRFDSVVDIDYYRHGGILPMILREKMK